MRGFFLVEAHDIQREVAEFLAQSLLVEHAKHGIFSVNRRHDRHAKIDKAAFVTHTETAVLRNAPFGDIELAHDFDARKNRGMPVFGQRLHGILQNAINAVFHDHFGIARFDVNVTRAPFERGKDYGVHQTDNGAHAGFARELLHGNIFFAVLFVADNLERETFGRLIENALRLLGALQQIANLRSGGNFDL